MTHKSADPFITIGMIVKNCEDTVGMAIHSIVAQDYQHDLLELIVVDGCSTDDTLCVVSQATRGSSLAVSLRVFSDEGRGLGHARQIVVDYARGRYVLWVDSDATIPRNYISDLVAFLESHPKHGGVRGIEELGGQEGLIAKLEELSVSVRTTVFDTDGQLFRVEAIRQVRGFDVHIGISGEDVELVLRMMKWGWSFSVIPTRFQHRAGTQNEIFRKRMRDGYGYHYRLHSHNVVSSLPDQIFPIALIFGLKDAMSAYALTGEKASFLLPLWYCVNGIPWLIGFAKSHIDGYGHAGKCREVSR